MNQIVPVPDASAACVWEWPHYPQYYQPRADIRMEAFVEGNVIPTPHGEARLLLRKSAEQWTAGRLITASPIRCASSGARSTTGTRRTKRCSPPRSPYKRVDALRSNRAVRLQAAGARRAA